MTNRLEIEVGAEIKELQKKLAQAEKELNSFDKTADKNLGKFSKSTKTATKDIKGFQKGTANGSSAMTAFSRTVQDAPFGLMGVSNNITNLTEQFGYLKAKTGSAGGALKAMLRDLKGFGGISLAISAVTSLLLVFGDKIFKTKDNVKELNKQNEEFVTGLKSLETTLNGLSLSQDQLNSKIEDYILLQKIKANADAQEEKSTEKLKKINENLVKEKEKLASAQNLLNVNTIAYGKSQNKETTRAKGYAKAITNNNNIIAESTSKITNLEKEKRDVILDSLSILKKYREQRNKLKEAIDGSVASLENQKSKLEKEQKQVSINSKTWQEYAEKIKNVQTQIDNIKGVSSSKKIYTPVFIDFKLDNSSFDEIKQIDLGNNDWIGDSPFDWENYFKLKDLDTKQKEVQAKLLEFNTGVSNIIQGTLSQTFSQLGQSLGEALVTGGNVLQAVGNTIIGGMANFIGKLGSMLVEYGTMAVLKGKLDLAILAGGPVAIGAGLAAIAVGTALSALSGAIGSFSSSGGQSNAQAGQGSSFSSGSSSFSGGATSSGGTYVFEIQGQKLVGVLKNTLDRNKNLGGTLGLT